MTKVGSEQTPPAEAIPASAGHPCSAPFNLFAITILEQLKGRKLAPLLAERTGETERTWRNRLKKGWTPSPVDATAFRRDTEAYIRRVMADEGLPPDEAKALAACMPSWKAGYGLPTADLIYWNSHGFGEGYAQAINVASQFDGHSYAIFNAYKEGDVDSVRAALRDALLWLRSYCAASEDMSDADALDRQLQDADNLPALTAPAAFLSEQMRFHVLSCWDLEFCANYFSTLVEPYPLFGLVMPRFSNSIVIEKGTGRFLRNSQPPKVHVFEKSMARLFDFLAVLIYWYKRRRFPSQLPEVKDMAAWFKQDAARIVSWRDETTRFTEDQFFQIWKTAVGTDKDGRFTAAPAPILVAAHLWSPLLDLKRDSAPHWIDCTDGYERWWKRNRDRLTAEGLQFGSIPWPLCLTGHPDGDRLLAQGYLPPGFP